MRKGRILSSVLAVGMACSLVLAPMSAGAEAVDETEFAGEDQGAPDQPAGENTTNALEGYAWAEFGDGLYKLDQNTDLSWLKNASLYGKFVPGEEAIEAETIVGLNDKDLYTALVSYDLATGTVYFGMPELFDQAIAVNVKDLLSSAMSGQSEGGGMYGQLVQMAVGIGAELMGQVQEFLASLPEDVWQQELMSYLMPIMSSLEQEAGKDVLTIGDVSVDVQTQTYTIPSEKMGDLISDLLTSLSEDAVITSLLESDAVANICGYVSMLSGGAISISGDELLEQFKGTVEALAETDYSGFPGVKVVVQSSEDRNAIGISYGFVAGDQTADILTAKAIRDGEKHCYEVIPGAVLLSAYNTGVKDIDFIGEGSIVDSKLNEKDELKINGETAALLTVTDFDLGAAMLGVMSGTISFEGAGMNLEIVYGYEDDGTRTVKYSVNGETFYDAQAWIGQAQDDSIEQINRDNAVEIKTADDAMNWIKTFNSDRFMEILRNAGVPVGETSGNIAA